MENEKQIIKNFAKWVDNQIDFKELIGGIGGNIAESVDGAIFKFAIEFGYSRIPTEFQDEALVVMTAISNGDGDTIAHETIEALVTNIKTPLSDEKESIILCGLWDIMHKLMIAK